ncbi:hypothetical protein VVT58_01925 [Sphingobium sp. SJ10-10]|uniref:hypothetical protein n=1 Tax=Sphingobium sp. SJ10-10 TaxID=3114999 RepID=UPI002E181E10|nr:hypothetical protein [Sphingobium sp. SJ10-10]
MKAIERRVVALESHHTQRRLSLEHVTDEALDALEDILSQRSFLDWTADDVLRMQGYGLFVDLVPGPGHLRDWFDPAEVAEYEASHG